MTNRSLSATLIFVLLFGLAASAEAQLFRRLPRGDDEQGNPELEQKKTAGDKAIQGGDFPKAIDLMDEVLRQNPRDSVAYYLRGSARVELGARTGDGKLIRDGVSDAREAIRYDTKRTAIYYLPYLHGMKNLATLENRREHAETAVAIASQVLGVPGLSNDDKANLLYQRGQAQAWLGKTDLATADFDEALKAVPGHFGARAALADVLAAAGKTEQAITAFNKLVEAFPDNALTYNNRGMFLQRIAKYDDAVADFTRSVERDPNYFYAFTNRGFTLLQMDNPVAAEADFTQSLKLNPQQPFVYNLRGLSKLSRGDVAGAIQDQRSAVDVNTKDPVARADLAFLLVFAEDFAGALQELEAAQGVAPEFRHLSPWKIVALQRLGKTQNLKEQFASSLSKDLKQRDWIDHLIAFVLGAESEADLLAAAAAANEPVKNDETCEANFFIGLTKAAAGKAAEATEAYQRALATKSRHLAAFRGSQFALKKLNPSGINTTAGVSIPSSGTTAKTPAGK